MTSLVPDLSDVVGVVVCGAGAAGLAAGAALRRVGADVIALERSDQVAARTDFLTEERG